MTRFLMIVGFGVLGYIGFNYQQTGRLPDVPALFESGGAFAGGYGMALGTASSVGSGIKGLAGSVGGAFGN